VVHVPRGILAGVFHPDTMPIGNGIRLFAPGVGMMVVGTALNRIFPPILVTLHALLLGWAVIGLAEWFLLDLPWPAVSNELLPRWLLLLHWLSVLGASLLFLLGYLLKWKRTPVLMIPAYSLMAIVCTIETIFFLTHPLRYVAMVLEYIAYVAIPFALLRLPSFVRHFQGPEFDTGDLGDRQDIK
jgi:hypothetical protein